MTRMFGSQREALQSKCAEQNTWKAKRTLPKNQSMWPARRPPAVHDVVTNLTKVQVISIAQAEAGTRA